MTSSNRIAEGFLGFVGAAIGAILGYYTFGWISHRGFYGMMIPGAMLGLGCGLPSRRPSNLRGALCAAAAVGLGLFVEWSFFPFAADPGLRYFISNIVELNAVTLLMIAGGAFLAYLLGKDPATARFGSTDAA